MVWQFHQEFFVLVPAAFAVCGFHAAYDHTRCNMSDRECVDFHKSTEADVTNGDLCSDAQFDVANRLLPLIFVSCWGPLLCSIPQISRILS